jgi:hypothetical protein
MQWWGELSIGERKAECEWHYLFYFAQIFWDQKISFHFQYNQGDIIKLLDIFAER